jgi:hypothetical protein
MIHPTPYELLEYLDNLLDNDKRHHIDEHIRYCNECETYLLSLKNIDTLITNIPLEKSSSNFTDLVMKRIPIKTTPSLLWTILKNLAPIFSIILVVGVMYGLIKTSGTLENSTIGNSLKITQQVYGNVESGIATATTKFNMGIKSVLSFLHIKGISGITLFVAVFLLVISILDKYIFMPMLRKKL